MFKTFLYGLGALCFSCLTHAAEPSQWDLNGVSEQLWQLSAERRIAESAITAAQANQQFAGRWANPELELAFDNSVGKEVGSGDSDLSQLTISQAIPLTGRKAAKEQQASAQLEVARAGLNQQQLAVQKEAAKLFHSMQYQQMRMALLQQQLDSAAEFQRIAQRREQSGDISRLERLRLDLISESARQMIAVAEGEYHEVESTLQTRLQWQGDIPPLMPMQALPPIPSLEQLQQRQTNHPELLQLKGQINTAQQEISLQKAQRIDDPKLWLSYERSYINGQRQAVSGAGISFSVPLWNQNRGGVESARQGMHQSRYMLEARQRQISQQLMLNHRHLGHLIDQLERHRTVMLAPAQEVFNLSREAFAVGQADILQLVDAVETYFQTEMQHLDLLYQAWLELSDLRYAAAIPLNTPVSSEKGIK